MARARTSGWDAGECAFDGLVVDTGSREVAEESREEKSSETKELQKFTAVLKKKIKIKK